MPKKLPKNFITPRSFVYEEPSFFTLADKKGFLLVEHNHDPKLNTLTIDPDEAFTWRNRERAEFELAEYDMRLKGFRVVEIFKTSTRKYIIK